MGIDWRLTGNPTETTTNPVTVNVVAPRTPRSNRPLPPPSRSHAGDEDVAAAAAAAVMER
jgi:hypothetical protein